MLSNSGFLKLRVALFSVARTNSSWRDGVFPKDYFTKKLVRSSGPGGQHVNKVATKVEIRFNVKRASEWLDQDVLERFMKVECNRISKLGDYIVSSDKTREAETNEADAYEKLKQILNECELQVQFENRQPSEKDVEILSKKAEISERNRRNLKERLKTKRKLRSKDFF